MSALPLPGEEKCCHQADKDACVAETTVKFPSKKQKKTVFPMTCSGTYALLYSFSSDGICFSLVYCKPESRLLLLFLLACLLTSPLILLIRSRNVIMGHYGSPSVWMSLASESNGAQFALATFNRVVRHWPVVGLRCQHK